MSSSLIPMQAQPEEPGNEATCHPQLAIKWYHCAKESDRGNKVSMHISKHFSRLLPEQAMHIRVIPTQDGQCYIVTFLQLCQN